MRESIFKAFFIAACLATGAAHGWWDHPCITRAAWDALPRELTAQYTDFERDELCFHTMMSDYPRMKTAGDFGYFQLWDAFMWRQRRAIVGYENGGGKDIDFARLMQSARTETALNTFLTAGCMLHGIEDQMSISHTVLPGPYQGEWHAPCETFACWRKYNLHGYVPRLLAEGYDPKTLQKACDARIKAVNGRAGELWAKIKPIIDENGIKQKPEVKLRTNERIDPFVQEFARGAGELVADVLYTLLSARRDFAANTGAALEGFVVSPRDALNADRSAKVYLRNADGSPTDYETMAFEGRFVFRNLPSGKYRLAATRLGAELAESDVFELAAGRTTRVNIALKASDPVGNQVWNPTGTWDLYGAGAPDRWRVKPLFNWGPLQQEYWRTSFMHLEPGWTYRFGAKLKKTGTEVRLRAAKGFGGHGPATILKFGDGALETEQTWTNRENFLKAKIEVVTTVALSDVIEKVWFVPVPPKGWKPGTPRADYVPLDDVFRTALSSEPPQPEFWQLRGEAGFSISDGGGTISHILADLDSGRATPQAIPCGVNLPRWHERMRGRQHDIAASGGMFDLVFIGDSITHFWETNNILKTNGQLQLDELRKSYSVLNLGYSGDVAQNLLWRVNHGELDGYKAKVVMLMIGVNDVMRERSAEETARTVKDILSAIRLKQPGARVALMAVLPHGRHPDPKGKWAAVNGIIKGFADGKDVVWFDIGPKFIDSEGNIPSELMSDYLHPTAAGYAIWRAALEPFFRSVCGK